MLSQEKINLIKELYDSGLSKTEISKQIPCSIPTVTKYTEKTKKDKSDEMIGQKFGKLTVLELLPKDKNLKSRCLRYKCQCDCGKIIEVNGNSLRSGHTLSCGCSRQKVNIKKLTGQRFGLLVVQDLAYINEERRAVWNCRCDCGNIIQVSSHGLLSGSNISCGCKHQSLGEKRVEELLQQLEVNYAKEYRIKDCKNIKPLPFDFAIFNQDNTLKCLIEYQGDIHFKISEGWNDEEKLKERQYHDKIKKEYCQIHNIQLIEIPYTDYKKLDINYIKRILYD